MLRLPVSDVLVELLPFTGAEDMLLLEAAGGELEVAVALCNRVARRRDGEKLDAARLPLTDVETLLLELRRMLLGDTVVARGQCPVPDCCARTDITFRLSEYMAHHRPRFSRKLPLKKETGWYGLPGSDVEFRLVTAEDLMAVMNAKNPKSALARLTIRPECASPRDVGRVERLMELLSPSLSQELQGACPECGELTRFYFNVRTHVERELAYESAFLYQDVHVLAARYHWSEEKILLLPRSRRLQYAELAMAATGAS